MIFQYEASVLWATLSTLEPWEINWKRGKREGGDLTNKWWHPWGRGLSLLQVYFLWNTATTTTILLKISNNIKEYWGSMVRKVEKIIPKKHFYNVIFILSFMFCQSCVMSWEQSRCKACKPCAFYLNSMIFSWVLMLWFMLMFLLQYIEFKLLV